MRLPVFAFKPVCFAVCLAFAVLTGCSDSRRPDARAYIESHPPENMKLAGIDDAYHFEDAGGGRVSVQIVAKYTTVLPAVRELNVLSLPEGVKVQGQLADVRHWAIDALPAGDPLRVSILATVDEASRGFPIKRIVTPAGTEVDGVVDIMMTADGPGWKIAKADNSAHVAGEPDRKPELPLEGSPEAAARFDELKLVLQNLIHSRDEFLHRREQLSAESLANMKRLLQTGRTFLGKATGVDSLPVRLVIGQGLEAGDDVVGTLVVEMVPQRSAQFSGRLRQEFDGRFVWEAARTQKLSEGSGFPNGGEAVALALTSDATSLVGTIYESGASAFQLSLREGKKVDIIPDRTAPSTRLGGQ